MDENQTNTSKNHTNNMPSRCNQNEKQKKRNNQREIKLHTQKKKSKNNDRDQKPNEKICRPLMTFTSIFRSVNEERKTIHGFETPKWQKNSTTIVKKDTK
jgi:hypothetical protein